MNTRLECALQATWLAIVAPALAYGAHQLQSYLTESYHFAELSLTACSLTQVAVDLVLVLLALSLFAKPQLSGKTQLICTTIGLVATLILILTEGFPPLVIGSDQTMIIMSAAYLVATINNAVLCKRLFKEKSVDDLG